MADGGVGEQPEPSNIVAKVEIVTDGDSGYLSVELVEGEPAADPPATSTARLRRLTGRHRMPATLPAWVPDRATTEAWLRRWWWMMIAVVSGVLILATVATVAVMVTTRG